MKNVELLNDRKVMLRRYRELPIDQKSLVEEAKQFGPGKYYASYKKQQNKKAGKRGDRRIVQRVYQEIYVYDDDYPEEARREMAATPVSGSRFVFMSPQQRAGAITPDVLRESLGEVIKPVLERIQKLETELEEEEEEEEETPESDILEDFLTLARRPEYQPVAQALMSFEPDEQKFQKLDAAFSQNPQLQHQLLMDLMAMVFKRVSGAMNA